MSRFPGEIFPVGLQFCGDRGIHEYGVHTGGIEITVFVRE